MKGFDAAVYAGLVVRLAGAALGAVRVGLIAVTLVLIFDQLVPSDRRPAYLAGSQLRPLCRWPGNAASDRCRRRSRPPSIA